MTNPEIRVRQASRQLWLAVWGSALCWGFTAGGGVWLAASLAGIATRAAPGAAAGSVAVLAGACTAGWLMWRNRGTRSPLRTALWIEEQHPELRYALVTLIDPATSAVSPSPALLTAAGTADIEGLVRQAVWRRLSRALVALLLVTLGNGLLIRLHGGLPVPGMPPGGRGSATAEVPDRLRPLRARVTPPAYSGLPPAVIKEPETLTALPGTAVVMEGTGAPEGITGAIAADSLSAVAAPEGWRLGFRVATTPQVLALRDRSYRRLVAIDPVPDSVPAVILRLPAHDTTYQELPAAPLALEARVTDDFGLATGYWELLITTGAGEQFETVARESRHLPLGGAHEGMLRLSLRLDTLKLTPGSVVNLRAVALDLNDVTGPGRGVSETRTLRLAAPVDSSAAAAEPPIPIDSMWVSQRLLNLRTDTLRESRAHLALPAFADRAMLYSNTQQQIRDRVIAVIALLEDDGVGGTAPTDESRLLREAADVMLQARLSLAMAEVDSARPPMRRALAILDEIRMARRYHIRGVLRPPPVDVARARLTGTEQGEPSPAIARSALTELERRLAERLQRLVRGAAAEPQAVADSLVFLRASLLQRRPDLALALTTAVERLRGGAAIAVALAPIRRILAPPPVRLAGPSEWTGGSAP